MGEPEKADPSQIVSYPWHDTWPYKAKSEILKCNYLLASDNLLDQTHAAYVHKSTLSSNPDAYATAKMETTPTPDGVKFIRWMLNCEPPNLYASAVPFKGRVDRWGEFEYVAPSCILQFTGAVDVGMGAYEKGNRDGGFGLAHVLRHHAGDRGHDLVLLVHGQWPPAKRSGSDRAIVPLDRGSLHGRRSCP